MSEQHATSIPAAPRGRRSTLHLATLQHEQGWSPGTFEARAHAWVDGMWFPTHEPDFGVPARLAHGPTPLWAALDEPRTVPLVDTDMDPCEVFVTIRRDGDVVHWELSGAATGHRTFDTTAYDAEVARHAADLSWERPGDTAERLVRQGIPDQALPPGVSHQWAGMDDDALTVCLRFVEADGRVYWIVIRIPGNDPHLVAADAIAMLRCPAQEWTCRWQVGSRSVEPPSLLGPGWRRDDVLWQRHEAVRALDDLLARGLRELDPAGVGPGAPDDEYRVEAELVAERIWECGGPGRLARLLAITVRAWFTPVATPPAPVYMPLAIRAWRQWEATRPRDLDTSRD